MVSKNLLFCTVFTELHSLFTFIWQHSVKIMHRGLKINIFICMLMATDAKNEQFSRKKRSPKTIVLPRKKKHSWTLLLFMLIDSCLKCNKKKSEQIIPQEIDSKWLWTNKKRNTALRNKNSFIVTLSNYKEREMAHRLTTSNRYFYQTESCVCFVKSRWKGNYNAHKAHEYRNRFSTHVIWKIRCSAPHPPLSCVESTRF